MGIAKGISLQQLRHPGIQLVPPPKWRWAAGGCVHKYCAHPRTVHLRICGVADGIILVGLKIKV